MTTTYLSWNQLERALSSKTDALDKRLMNGSLTQSEYDKLIAELDQWYEQEGDKLEAANAPSGYPSTVELLALGR